MADIVDLIKAQHRKVDDLLAQAEKAEPEQIVPLLQQVAEMLVPHSEAEEDFVYPAIRSYDSREGEEVKDGVAEHHHIDALMNELLAEDPSGPGYDGKLAAMIGELRHHVEEEETELLPVLSEQASDEEREELGARFAEVTGHQLEDEVEQGAAKGSSKGAAKSSKGSSKEAAKGSSKGASKGSAEGSSGGSASKDLTRDELYEQAKEKQVPGRSSMSKDELAKAVEKA